MAINSIETEISLNGNDYAKVFKFEETTFIKKHWPQRNEEKNITIQLAIYISMCRLIGNPALDDSYNKFGYWDTPPDNLNHEIKIWCNREAPYVFRSLRKYCRRMRHDCANDLLSCHTVDDGIIDAMDKYYFGEPPAENPE